MYKSKRGQVIVEFIVLVGVFMMVTLGALDLGMYMYTKYNFENAVRNGTRIAVKMKDWSSDEAANTEEIKDFMIDYCSNLPSKWRNNLRENIEIEFNPNVNNIDYIKVAIEDFNYSSLLGFTDSLVPDTLSAQAVMKYEY